MSVNDNFYLRRRSVLARKMLSEPIKDEDLKIILDAGIRVPDHGALNPWKVIVIKGEKRKLIDNFRRFWPSSFTRFFYFVTNINKT